MSVTVKLPAAELEQVGLRISARHHGIWITLPHGARQRTARAVVGRLAAEGEDQAAHCARELMQAGRSVALAHGPSELVVVRIPTAEARRLRELMSPWRRLMIEAELERVDGELEALREATRARVAMAKARARGES